VAPDGTLWSGVWGNGAFHFDGNTWIHYTRDNGLAGNRVLSVAMSPDGTVWFGTEHEGVPWFDGQIWTTYSDEGSLSDTWVNAIAVAPGGAVWFGTRNGVSQYSLPSSPLEN